MEVISVQPLDVEIFNGYVVKKNLELLGHFISDDGHSISDDGHLVSDEDHLMRDL